MITKTLTNIIIAEAINIAITTFTPKHPPVSGRKPTGVKATIMHLGSR